MRSCFLVGLVGMLCFTSTAKAILIETGGARVGGYLLRADDKKLTIRIYTPDGHEKVNDYPLDRIKIIHQLDGKRLEKLSQDNPKAYRDYANELAAQEGDPEASYVARRLYLISAYLDPQNFGSSSLLRLSALADTPAEARKCRALAFLLDPKADANILKFEAVKPPQPAKAQLGALQDFSKALQAYRSGKIKFASDTAKREGMEKIFSMAPGKIEQKTFLGWCSDANCPTCKMKGKVPCSMCNGKGVAMGPFGQLERCKMCNGQKLLPCAVCEGTGVHVVISEDDMRNLLRAELWALEQISGGEAGGKKPPPDKNWSSVLQTRQLNPVLPLSLETITEFDPRKCQYRNGAWVSP